MFLFVRISLKNENAGGDSDVKKMGKLPSFHCLSNCNSLLPPLADFRLVTSDRDDLNKAALRYLAPVSFE